MNADPVDPIYTTLAHYVRREREARGLSIPGLAEAAGVDRFLIRRVEGAQNAPAFHAVVRVLLYFEATRRNEDKTA